MSDHYGEQWRPWPGGCPCHGDGAGYFMDYWPVFDGMFDRLDYTTAPDRVGTLYLTVHPEGDAAEMWWWTVGYFSWTPDGDLWERRVTGQNPTRLRAEAACREAAHNIVGEKVRAR